MATQRQPTPIETIYKVYHHLNAQTLASHNSKLLRILDRKINCYQKHWSEPYEYYKCFDRVEIESMNDHRKLEEAANLIESDFQICWDGCKTVGPNEYASQEGHFSKCVQKCTTVYNDSLKLVFKRFYEKEGISE